MAEASVHTLPKWKKGSSPGEWLSECAGLAYESPEQWERIALIYSEVDEEQHVNKTRYQSYHIPTNTELIGAFEVGKILVAEALLGR